MRIHTSFLTSQDLYAAASKAGVSFTKLEEKGSRSAARAFEVILTGSSSRNQNMGGTDKAATWDEWGVFLYALYSADDTVSSPYYSNLSDFNFQTGHRFEYFTPEDAHKQHHWEHDGVWDGATHFFCKGSKGFYCEATMHRNLR